MASGVKCADSVTEVYNQMRLKKADVDPKDRPRIVCFKIKDGVIDVCDCYRERDVEGEKDVHQFFADKFDEKTCCYFLYDCHYETKETPKEELVFVMWTPDDSKISDKMQYSSSKQSLTSVLKGIKHILEIQQRSDVTCKEDFADRLGRGITKVEGHCLKHCTK